MVPVSKGAVVLTGIVRSYVDKCEAEADAKQVAGVAAVTNEIEVRLPSADRRLDSEIALDASTAIKAQLPVSCAKITIVVTNGWVTLGGEVEWQSLGWAILERQIEWEYQRLTAELAVRPLKGVRGISNEIQVVRPLIQPSDVKRIKQRIQDAFRHSAEVDANRITIEANGSAVIS